MGWLGSYGVFTPEQDNDKTNVEPVHSYDAFQTRHVEPGVKGIIGMHRFNNSSSLLYKSCVNVLPLSSHASNLCFDGQAYKRSCLSRWTAGCPL